MTDSGSIQKTVAIAVIIISLAASATLAVRTDTLQADVQKATVTLAESKHKAALAIIDSGSLPPNRGLTICNSWPETATISALTASYWDRQGKLRTFNSAKHEWHTWEVPAGATKSIALAELNGSGWDGSVVFYAMDLSNHGKGTLLSGTSDDLKSGCIFTAAIESSR